VWVDGHLNGEEIHKSLRTRDWQKAQKLVRDWESAGERLAEKEANQPVTVEAAWLSFLADLEARKLRACTIRKHRLLSRTMQAFAKRRGMRCLREIDLAAIRDFRSEWTDGALSSSKKLERLRSFYRFAQDNNWIEGNPATKVKAPKPSQRPTLPFTQEEIVRILAATTPYVESVAASGKNRALGVRGLILLLRYSGLRIGDAVKVPVDSIDGNKLFLYTQKTGVPVYTVLPNFVVRALESTPRVTPIHLFCSGAGDAEGVVGSWRKRLAKVFRLAQVSGGHPHRFRDTFATELLLAGVPIERVAVLLGHRSVKITERYYAAWTDARQRQVEADLLKAWRQDPIVLLEEKGTQKLHGKNEVLN
jgi:integrase/recombinase XerD